MNWIDEQSGRLSIIKHSLNLISKNYRGWQDKQSLLFGPSQVLQLEWHYKHCFDELKYPGGHDSKHYVWLCKKYPLLHSVQLN